MDRKFRAVRLLGAGIATIAVLAAIALGQGLTPRAIDRVYYYCSVHHRVDPHYMPRTAYPVVRPFRHSLQLKREMKEVDRQLLNAGRDYERVLSNLENDLAEKPEDSVRLFRLGYAFAQAWKISAGQGSALWWEGNHRQWNDLLRLMVAVPPTGPIAARGDEASFEWQRMRFVNQGGATFQPELIPLGQALLQQDPIDYSVRRALVQLLADKLTDADTKMAIALCDEALPQPVLRASWLSMKSYAFQIRWAKLGRRQEDLEAAIEATRQSIQALMPNARVKHELEQMLTDLKKDRSKSR